MSLPRAAVAAACLSVCPLSALAAGESAAATIDPLDEVVITATRSATPVSGLALPVIVIDRAAIEASQAYDVAQLLAGQAGVEIGRSGGPGQPASVFLRGTDSNHTAVLIDGVPINPGTLGGAALQDIAPEDIERIEIVKGARATLYGNSAIGGVINIITRAGSAQGLGASLGGGSWHTRNASADGGTSIGALQLGAALAWRDSDGFPTLRSLPEDRGYDNFSANGSLRYTAGDALTLSAHAWRSAGNTQYTGYDSNFNLAGLDEDYRVASYAAGAEWRAGTTHWHALASRSEDLLQQNQSADHANTRRNALDLGAGWQLPVLQQLDVGALLSHEHTDSLSYGTGYHVGTDVWQAYAQDRLQLARSSLLLAAAHLHEQGFGTHDTWNAELTQPLAARLTFTAAAGSAFRAPDSTDRFGYGGTPDLQPERSLQYELGLQLRLSGTQQLRLDAFDNRIDDLIDFDYASNSEQNIARARIRGVELGYRLAVDGWHADAQLTLQRARDPDTDTDLLRRARRHGGVSLGRDGQRFDWNLQWQASGRRLDYGYPDNVQLGGYALVNLSATWRPQPQWALQLAIANALDHDYELASGYDTGGRSVNLALRYRFRQD